MPIFEYVCVECGQPFEKLVLSTSKTASLKNPAGDKVTCPICRSQNVRKKISGFASHWSGRSSLSFGSSSSCATGSV